MPNENKKRILVICHIIDTKSNGQIAKTKDVCAFLESHNYKVDLLNYGEMSLLKVFLTSKRILKKYDRIILMPGGRKALFLYTHIICKLKIKNAHYVAIGGWVLKLLQNPKYKKHFEELKKFKGVYLQNHATINEFEKRGFKNVYYVSSFSTKKPLTKEEKEMRMNYYNNMNEFNFCFFARVERAKGVLLACESIIKAREMLPNKQIRLDIYGEIKDPILKDELFSIIEQHPYISYKGAIDGNEAIGVLSKYYSLLFPTFYYGEGTPHSVIESFMAGLPVIASDWAYNKEVISDGKTGLIFNLNTDELTQKIIWSIQHKDEMKKISSNCFNEVAKYNIDILLKPLLENLEN